MAKFLQKQLERAESKKLGRVERSYSIDSEGSVKETSRRESAQKCPPLTVQNVVPVGRPRGVCKPGEEY